MFLTAQEDKVPKGPSDNDILADLNQAKACKVPFKTRLRLTLASVFF